MSCHTVLGENRSYWTGRSATYSQENRAELEDAHREIWKTVIAEQLSQRFPDRKPEDLRVLEVGTGPGFFAIILTEAGYRITAIDLTPAMLKEAKSNAGALAEQIEFREMNAEELEFPDESFDAIVTRNLTWNLPHPEKAYSQWHRVLKPGGMLLNFDANWYQYLFDAKAKAGYEQDRQNTAEKGFRDQNIGENYDVMENIARKIPLSSVPRPQWDSRVLTALGMEVDTNEAIWKRVWSEQEQVSFASTPMFLVKAIRQ